jgi:hypothetical protein
MLYRTWVIKVHLTKPGLQGLLSSCTGTPLMPWHVPILPIIIPGLQVWH